jgi:hypothetical protein
MGTNYYWYPASRVDTCLHCGQEKIVEIEKRHIGKSSGGWTFALHVYPENSIKTLLDWIREWFTKKGDILDEYGNRVIVIQMLQVIIDRGNCNNERIQSKEWYRENHAIKGPKGLARRTGDWVVGYGEHEGTWDCCIGDFS